MNKYEIYNYRFLFTASQYVQDNLGQWISMKYINILFKFGNHMFYLCLY